MIRALERPAECRERRAEGERMDDVDSDDDDDDDHLFLFSRLLRGAYRREFQFWTD